MNEQRNPARLPEPPPADFALDLRDGDRAVGWITPRSIGFHGFESDVEAVHAAWASHRTLSWRLAAKSDRRLIPVDVSPVHIEPYGDDVFATAEGKRFARLLPPDGVREGWSFELTLPQPMGEVMVRGKAHAIYIMLRRSGIRWSMWRPAESAASAARGWKW